MFISLLFLLVHAGDLEAVPATQNGQCHFPRVWRDLWDEPAENRSISILTEDWDAAGKCELELEEVDGVRLYIVAQRRRKCYVCVYTQQLHSNILRYKQSPCRKVKDARRLCYGEVQQQKWKYLYRHAAPTSQCPDILQGSHEFTYTEYSPTTNSYIEGCGDPRSEMNSCNQRSAEDPQLSINFGNCPNGVQVHRTSMNHILNCYGSWGGGGGVQYMVAKGDIYEYWEPGDYRNKENEYVCMAMETDGLKIYLSQGFGSGCDGVGGTLSPRNGLRNLVLEKRMRLEENCQFPSWVLGSPVWQIIPQGGLRMPDQGPREVEITSKTSFRLGAGGLGQTFSCAKILESSADELKIQMFSQDKCYGEYHCFHAKYSANSGSIQLHVGAPSANIEHSCVAPSFDPEVPFLLATIIPANSTRVDLSSVREVQDNFQDQVVNTGRIQGQGTVGGDSMDQILRETGAQLHTLTQQFTSQISTLMRDFAVRVKSSFNL